MHAPAWPAEVTRVNADGAEFGARDLDGIGHAGGDVVRVDEQGGADAESLDLGTERGLFVGTFGACMQQRERVGAGAQCGHAVAALSFEIGRAGEAGEEGRPGCGHGCLLVGSP